MESVFYVEFEHGTLTADLQGNPISFDGDVPPVTRVDINWWCFENDYESVRRGAHVHVPDIGYWYKEGDSEKYQDAGHEIPKESTEEFLLSNHGRYPIGFLTVGRVVSILVAAYCYVVFDLDDYVQSNRDANVEILRRALVRVMRDLVD